MIHNMQKVKTVHMCTNIEWIKRMGRIHAMDIIQ